jgi:hypothetical protein
MDFIFAILAQEANKSKDFCQKLPWGYSLLYAKNCSGDTAVRMKDSSICS